MNSRSSRARIIDITIASLVGGILGAFIGWVFHPDVLIVDQLHAKQILVDGKLGTVSINGDVGISLNRDDYATAELWFHEPGTGDPGTGGPVLWISGKEAQAFKATPSGQVMVPLKRDDRDGL
jgi:hypothetical protein